MDSELERLRAVLNATEALLAAHEHQMLTKLGDDAFVQAYREHGSYRKAAAALSKPGLKVSKDAVQRAVERAGGARAVKRDADSESVRRTVASQRRDRQRKFASPSQPSDIE